MVLAFALPVLLMSRDEFAGGEFPACCCRRSTACCLLQSADSFATVFLGLELMSLPVYVLVLLAYRRPQSAEAALKYLVLGGTATAMFLMGASLLYGAAGSLAIDAFAQALGAGDGLARAAVVLVVLAFFLKAAIVPFHAWAPDAYEAASVPVTAYMATMIKAGVLLAALRLFGTRPARVAAARAARRAAARLDRLGQPRGDAPAELASHDRLQLDRPRRLSLLRAARRPAPAACRPSRSTCSPTGS